MNPQSPEYQAALAKAEENRKACYERCKAFVTNPSVLEALRKPITTLRRPPVEVEDEDEDEFITT